jgi:hypothetical protein
MHATVFEKPLRVTFLSLGVAVLLCFPAVFLTWPKGTFQVVQFTLSVVAAAVSGVYLLSFRRTHKREAAWIVFGSTAALVALELVGIVITSWRFD